MIYDLVGTIRDPLKQDSAPKFCRKINIKGLKIYIQNENEGNVNKIKLWRHQLCHG